MCKAIVFVSVMFGMLLLGPAQTAANPTWPPVGNITPFADAAGTIQIIENPAGVVSIYFVLTYNPGLVPTIACLFSAPKPSCFDAEFLGEECYSDQYIGNTQTGLAILFGTCPSSWPTRVLLAKSTYYVGEGYSGATGCCFWWVLPAPWAMSGKVEFADCNETTVTGFGGALVFNPDDIYCAGVPVESTTWGKVKSLYAQ
jgi:hypothetical protein